MRLHLAVVVGTLLSGQLAAQVVVDPDDQNLHDVRASAVEPQLASPLTARDGRRDHAVLRLAGLIGLLRQCIPVTSGGEQRVAGVSSRLHAARCERPT